MDLATDAQLVVSGLTIGCVYSLVALGFALTLRATNLINFAQGELVTLGAFIGLSFLSRLGLPYPLAFAATVVIMGNVGVLLERAVVRPIIRRRAPQLNLLIATLGLSIALQAAVLLIWGREPIPYPPLFRTAPLVLFGLRTQTLNLWILGLGLSAMAALQFFFRHTLTGISWRAAALDPDTASLYGVSRKRNMALTFGISAALAGGAGVLIAPLFFASFELGRVVLIKAFAAAAIGGFGIVGTMAGGLLLGLIETLVAGLISSEYKNVIVYALLLVILMFFFRPNLPAGRSMGEGSRIATSSPIIAGRALVIAGGVAALAWLALPLLIGTYPIRVLNLAMIFGIAVLGLQLIVGVSGQLSFGHAAFFGIGAYTAALLALKLGVPAPLTLPCAMLTAAGAALLLTPVLRLSGHYLAIATLAMGEIVFLLINTMKSITNGAYGLYGIPAPGIAGFDLDTDAGFFVLASVLMFVTWFLLNRLTGSRFGRSLAAIRENERAALACGINAAAEKARAFIIGSACAGLAGGLYAHYMAYINPNSFTFDTSVEMVTMLVIGGLGSMSGSLVGAFAVATMPEYLRFLADYRLLIYGGALIVFMLFLPGGLMDLVRIGAGLLRPRSSRPARLAPSA